ncbi:MAG: hypothetical protein R3199_12005 [Gemmatimonadota bacterium]|nr:hypothetical protein [Gemmatimonadota bacterium]
MTRRRESVWAQGLVAGAIGYLVVVVFYAAFNLATGRPLFLTAEVLGLALLGERSGASAATGNPAPIAVYNGLHLVVFLALGFASAWLVEETERHPSIWYLAVSLALFVLFHIFGAVAGFAAPVREAVPIWSVLVATLSAVTAMAIHLWKAHPALAGKVESVGDLEDRLEAGG